MENISKKLFFLRRANYLQATLEPSKLHNLELLSLGKCLRSQIEAHWQLSQVNEAAQSTEPPLIENFKDEQIIKEVDPRLKFVFTKLFRENVKLLKPSNDRNFNFFPIKVKLVEKKSNFIQSDCLKFNSDASEGKTQLVIDHFFHESCGLAKLYQIQRERKIWWMRFSSDPSRYYLEPYTFSQNSAELNAQSISLKSRLCFDDLEVEHITLVPLTDATLEHKKDFEIFNRRTKRKQLPTVIRSVIDLDVAACALIFDGIANKKRNDTLFLNRKVAPYQCQVIIESNDPNSTELVELSTHISNVISRSGLRILKTNETKTEHNCELETQQSDELGIPYTILVNSDSLRTGLLKLRSRDTTLKETIHISDIPKYLLSIFFSI